MSHYYNPATGQLLPPVQQKNGQWREAGLRDARLVGALPSVTTILQLLDKPGLRDYFADQLIAATRAAAKEIFAQDADIPAIIKAQARDHANSAADFGTQVHAGISARLKGQEFFSTDVRVLTCVKGFWEWADRERGLVGFYDDAEETFCNLEWGFAGTIDAMGVFKGEPAIFDFKTQEAATPSDFNLYDPDYPLQLAGYALGTGNPDHKRVSVMISRTTPGLVKLHEWKDNARFDRMWVNLLAFWQERHKYYSGTKVKEVLGI